MADHDQRCLLQATDLWVVAPRCDPFDGEVAKVPG